MAVESIESAPLQSRRDRYFSAEIIDRQNWIITFFGRQIVLITESEIHAKERHELAFIEASERFTTEAIENQRTDNARLQTFTTAARENYYTLLHQKRTGFPRHQILFIGDIMKKRVITSANKTK